MHNDTDDDHVTEGQDHSHFEWLLNKAVSKWGLYVVHHSPTNIDFCTNSVNEI